MLAGMIVPAVTKAAIFAASPYIPFEVSEFTSNTLTITFTETTAIGGPVPTTNLQSLYFVSSDSSDDWINFDHNINPNLEPQGISIGGNDLVAISNIDWPVSDPSNQDQIIVSFDENLAIANTVPAGSTFTISETGLFNPSAISEMQLYWGLHDTPTSGSLQSSVAVPEPSTYAIIFGVIGLGFVLFRRRTAW